MSNPMSMQIDDKKFKQFMAKYPEQVKRAVKDSLLEGILKVQNKAKSPSFAPFITGNLRRSLTMGGKGNVMKVEDYQARTGTDLDYAAIQEFGGKAGRNQSVTIPPYKGRGYLRPALSESEKEIIEIFSKNINNITK